MGLKWKTIYEECIERFGFSEEFLELHRKEKEIATMQAEMILSNDPTRELLITVEMREYESMKKQMEIYSGKVSFEEAKATLETELSIPRINPYECTVAEYYGYLKLLRDKVKAKKQNNKKQNG